MKILLTGATGGLGFRTLEKLVENPLVEKIIATGRTIKPNLFVDHPKVQYILGSLEDSNFVDELVQQVDCIIHTAALSSPWGTYVEFERANLLSTQHLISAAKKYNIKRFVFISTPSIYFNYKNRFNISEEDILPNKLVNAYAITKLLAEQALQKSTIPYVILRPRSLIGRGDMVIMPRMIRAHSEGKLKIIGDGKNIVDLTSLANVAHAIELSLFVGSPGINQIYNISNGEPVNLWSTINHLLGLLGYQPIKNNMPYWLAKSISGALEIKAKLTNHKEPVLTNYSVGILGKSFTMNIDKAKLLLGYRPIVSTEEAIVEFAETVVNCEL